MKISFLNGGLANQAFQYIFSRHYELSHPNSGYMYLDDSYFALHTVHNGYELEKVFGIKAHMLSECFTANVWEFMLEERKKGKSIPQILCENGIETYMVTEADSWKSFNPFDGKVFPIPCNQYFPDIMNLPGDGYYHGYWINKNWFSAYRDIFLQEFQFPEITDDKNCSYLEQIENSDSVSVHIRRGDYVTLGWNWDTKIYQACSKKVLEELSGNPHLFVFSDDIPWCQAHETLLGFSDFPEITYIEGNTAGQNYRDMQLMSRCKAMILSNSAFCYLAALLNTKKQYILNPSSREI